MKGALVKFLSFCRTMPPLATSETATRGVDHTHTLAWAVHNHRSISRTNLLLQSCLQR